MLGVGNIQAFRIRHQVPAAILNFFVDSNMAIKTPVTYNHNKKQENMIISLQTVCILVFLIKYLINGGHLGFLKLLKGENFTPE